MFCQQVCDSLLAMAFFFLLLSVLLLPNAGHAKIFLQRCDKNFTNNESLQSSISSAILDVVAQSSAYGYAASRYGSDNDPVYAISLCRGDISDKACSDCIQALAQSGRKDCPSYAEYSGWLDDGLCFIHFDTDNFLGDPNYAGDSAKFRSSVIAKNPEAFDRVVRKLMGEVTANAASSVAKFGWGENHDDMNNITIQGMAQCTRDLSQPACYQCLKKALETVYDYCRYHFGCRDISPKCAVKIDSPFLINPRRPVQDTPAIAPAPAV